MYPVLRKRTYVPNLANHFLGGDLLSSLFSDGADYSVPAVNIKENETAFEIEMAAPGLKKEDLQIKLEKNVLTISSERKSDQENQKDHFMRREFSYHAFCRSFSLPDHVDADKIKASHVNGVLMIELPKFEKEASPKSKTIKIS